jgi:hypothetical protein
MTKSGDASPAAPRGVQEAAPDDPASTSSIDHLSVAPQKVMSVLRILSQHTGALVVGIDHFGKVVAERAGRRHDAGQPVCEDQDSLGAALVAAVVLGTSPALARYGCQTIPKDAKVEILQRFPSGFEFLRVIKVNVTSPSQADATVGYTFEIRR